jgi:hypothetical protein
VVTIVNVVKVADCTNREPAAEWHISDPARSTTSPRTDECRVPGVPHALVLQMERLRWGAARLAQAVAPGGSHAEQGNDHGPRHRDHPDEALSEEQFHRPTLGRSM